MATRRVSHAKPPPEGESLSDLSAEPNERPAPNDSGIAGVLAELAGADSAKITVYRVVKGRPLVYVTSYDAHTFDLNDLRDVYDGGEFRLFITRDGELWKTVTVHVEEGRAIRPPTPPTDVPDSQRRGSPDQSLADILRDGFERQTEILQRRTTRGGDGPASLLSGVDLPATITAIAAAITALRPNPPPPPPVQVSDSSDRAIDMLLKGIELARELKGDGDGGEPTMMGLMRDLVKSPLLAKAVEMSAMPQAPQPRPVAVSHAKLAPPPPPDGGSAPASTFQPTPMNPTQYLAFLCTKAAEDADPLLYADLVLDNVDESVLKALLGAPPTPVDYLIAQHAPIAEHRDWFTALVDAVRGALDTPQEGVIESGHDSGTNSTDLSGGTPQG